MPRRDYTDGQKAAAVAARLSGQAYGAISDATGIPVGTIKRWVDNEQPVVATEKKQELGALVATYLGEALTTLAAQARHSRDPAWLARQNASDLAILHGVLTDKTIRLLAALESADGVVEIPSVVSVG